MLNLIKKVVIYVLNLLILVGLIQMIYIYIESRVGKYSDYQ